MTNTVKELLARKSVRQFTDQEISEDIKNEILLSIMNAPTAGNQQMYSIIDVEDKDLKKKLSVLCDNQPFINDAKWVLVFVADFERWFDAFKSAGLNPRTPGKGDLMLAVTDACIAAENGVTAAESYGIGSCYIGDIMENCEEMTEVLNLPTYTFPCAMLVFGYPTESQIVREKPKRFDVNDIVMKNQYIKKSDEELQKMHEERTKLLGYDEWMKRFCERKYSSDFSKEMTRSVSEYIKRFE